MKISVTILVVCLVLPTLSSGQTSESCNLNCKQHPKKAVCGDNGVTYQSFCELQKAACLKDKAIGFACDGECPCDPPEVLRMDAETVRRIQKERASIQLLEHEKEELNSNQDYFTLKVLDEKDVIDHMVKIAKKEETKKVCKNSEMAELPSRLIDWFHVLKVNEKVQVMRDERMEEEPVMHGEDFANEKIRAMYSTLACVEQKDDEVEKAVCLKPVKWMFHHLDSNKDNSLSASELHEIEDIEKEHCIKPFLKNCDANNDGKVVLAEFCRCLCITPPCTRVIKDLPSIILRGVPKPMPGFFVPSCDEDGFFMPKQCNPRNECWCVDRNGAEFQGTRVSGQDPKCAAYNTNSLTKNVIPLDVKKENKQ